MRECATYWEVTVLLPLGSGVNPRARECALEIPYLGQQLLLEARVASGERQAPPHFTLLFPEFNPKRTGRCLLVSYMSHFSCCRKEGRAFDLMPSHSAQRLLFEPQPVFRAQEQFLSRISLLESVTPRRYDKDLIQKEYLRFLLW